jgi:hypothetical protein
MPEAASAHKAATETHADISQQRFGRTRRTSADPKRAQQGATAAALAAPAALDSLSRLQQLADASPQVAQLRRLQALANARFAPVAQLAGDPEEEELLKGKFATAELQPQLQQAPRVNNTGLPDQLKSGIESLSGLSMDHVRVHYNSSQPAQLNALAYAQGSNIHLAPGQEQHLPHEAWHVVQQAQGRVRPTLQLKDGVPVNDDVGLEREADVMGSKALEGRHRVVDAHHSISVPIETAQSINRDATNSLGVNMANNDNAPLANGRGSAQRGGNEMQRIADHRPEAALQRQVQAWGDGSERVGQLRAWQGVADGKGVGGKRQDLTLGFDAFDSSPRVTAQAKRNAALFGPAIAQRKPVVQMVQVPNNSKYAVADVSALSLYRGSSSLQPATAIASGFDKSGGTYASIIVHLMNNGEGSKWISTTSDRTQAEGYAGAAGWVYMFHGIAQRGLDANAAYLSHWSNKDEQADLREAGNNAKLSAYYPFQHQAETSVWNSIAGAEIAGIGAHDGADWRYYTKYQIQNKIGLPKSVSERL